MQTNIITARKISAISCLLIMTRQVFERKGLNECMHGLGKMIKIIMRRQMPLVTETATTPD